MFKFAYKKNPLNSCNTFQKLNRSNNDKDFNTKLNIFKIQQNKKNLNMNPA